MVTIRRKIELDYGHTLPNHFSFCNQLHGHRAVVVATVCGEVNEGVNGSSQGMVLDFKILKDIMMEKIHGVLDHGFAVWRYDRKDLEFIKDRNDKLLITEEPPTAEYLAKWAYHQLLGSLPQDLILRSVEWFETPNASALFGVEK